jgi:hypothetical protein
MLGVNLILNTSDELLRLVRRNLNPCRLIDIDTEDA